MYELPDERERGDGEQQRERKERDRIELAGVESPTR